MSQTDNAALQMEPTYYREYSKPVAWIKHGPYEEGEGDPPEFSMTDPRDDVSWSPLL